MARGRKRLIAGWAFIALGVVVSTAFVTSRWFEFHTSLRKPWCFMVSNGNLFASYGFQGFAPPDSGIGYERLDSPALEWTARDTGSDFVHLINLRIFRVDRSRSGFNLWMIGVSLWPVAIAAFGVGTQLIRSYRRIKGRGRVGQCMVCGYDLKGLDAGKGCPECGKNRATKGYPRDGT